MHPRESTNYSEPSASLVEWERELVGLLSSETRAKPQIRRLSQLLLYIFVDALRSVSRESPIARWSCDGLSPRDPEFIDSRRVQIDGICFWLVGGKGCERFSFDVDLSREPLRYSFKLFGGRRETQALYVAKTDEGWYVNAT